MKISPLSNGGQPGQTLGSVDVGRTANPVKLERARAIARGEKVAEEPAEQVQQAQPNARRLKMRTNFSTNREEPAEQVTEASQSEPAAASSTSEVVETGAVEATQPLSPQFAALARQKRALQVKERELLDREKALTAQSQGSGSEDLIARLKTDTLSVLQEHGILSTPEFYNSISEKMLSGETFNPEIHALKEEIKALKKGVDESFQTQEQRNEEAALTEMLNEAESLSKEGDEFELIRASGDVAYDKVLRLIHSTYKKSGRVLDVREAMNTIENQLLIDAEKFAGLNKVRSKFAPQDPLKPQQPGMRTLTARDTAVPSLGRRARAIAAMQGTLRK